MSYEYIMLITAVVNTVVNVLREIRERNREKREDNSPLSFLEARGFILMSSINLCKRVIYSLILLELSRLA